MNETTVKNEDVKYDFVMRPVTDHKSELYLPGNSLIHIRAEFYDQLKSKKELYSMPGPLGKYKGILIESRTRAFSLRIRENERKRIIEEPKNLGFILAEEFLSSTDAHHEKIFLLELIPEECINPNGRDDFGNTMTVREILFKIRFGLLQNT